MNLDDVVLASASVAQDRSRLRKTGVLAELLSAAGAAELPVVVAWLSGEIPQGRLGVGWRSIAKLDATPGDAPTLTVTEVDAALTALATATGAGSAGRRTETLRGLMSAATESEQRFLIALLTGELRQGALAGVMTDAIAKASHQPLALVRRAHMLTGSLPATAGLAVLGGADALAGVTLQVGRGVQPMLATPAENLDDALAVLGTDVVVDYKLDGARVQVHRQGSDIRVFTRTLHDVTERVPDIVAVVAELSCESVILDGETLTLDGDGRPRPFQETMSRFGSGFADGAEADVQRVLRPFFFDCLHLDGADLIDRPLSERLAAIDSIAPALRIPSVTAPTPDEARTHFDAALADGHEGVMVKSLSGTYTAGRRGKAWQKVKPVHTFDLVVLAAEWGSGRRRGWLSNLHLGARDSASPDTPIMVGKTFKGLTDELLRWQTEEFPRHEIRRDDHTVYLRPEIVVEIELDGVQRSSRYPGGVALRFARVVRYRPDKTADQADTIETIRGLLK
ncbi:ATP-dependent DNA ligase [Gordonia sp. ABSL49_1]|uniref:ATP-dependent DNA ligase n=1 Tax=Gordonia sp. ABSL49_1 TaxID=2920941 RepID=UPI001F0D61E5|nr:ATP-dependent DNA ligase [Gordonia sp. ABSL49_1]MCH5642949.1 ATP-dependent DNA ligase [Gordonia sp. ABSL49_1]